MCHLRRDNSPPLSQSMHCLYFSGHRRNLCTPVEMDNRGDNCIIATNINHFMTDLDCSEHESLHLYENCEYRVKICICHAFLGQHFENKVKAWFKM